MLRKNTGAKLVTKHGKHSTTRFVAHRFPADDPLLSVITCCWCGNAGSPSNRFIYFDSTCEECGKVCGDVGYYSSCGHYSKIWSGVPSNPNPHPCGICNGVKWFPCAKHGQLNAHSYCLHNKIEKHDD